MSDVSEIIEMDRLDLHVALPGRIISYDSSAQTCNVELQVKSKIPTTDKKYVTKTKTDLMNVPVLFPRSKDFFISFPLAKGDTGLVVFNEMSIDQWRSLGRVCDPKDIGRHTLTGAVFIPGLVPNSEALDGTNDVDGSNMVIGKKQPDDYPATKRPRILITDTYVDINEGNLRVLV